MHPDDAHLAPYPVPKELQVAMQDIVAYGQNDVARLPEPLFATKLLPVLTDRSGHADLTIWLEIAGNGFRPIDVFDPITGDVLFRVPSLFVEQKVGKIVNGRGPIAAIVEEANLKSNQHPAIGQTFLKNQLANRPYDMTIDLERIRTWNAILAKYGHPPVIELSGQSSETATAPEISGQLIGSVEQEDF